jgi:hypothetical protein
MRLGRLGCCTLLALILAAAPAATAQASEPPAACPGVETFRPFSPWGDERDYAAIPGGSFDDDVAWSGSGTASVVAADNPFQLGSAGTRAALLNSGDSFTSPSICIDRSYPLLRFVARAVAGPARLGVAITWVDARGNARQTMLDGHDAKRYQSWGVSRAVRLRDALPRREEIRDVHVRFFVDGKAGAWLIDDVFIDPYKRG